MEEEIKKSKKLAVISFILSFVPIILIILYFFLRNIFISAPNYVALDYNYLVQYFPVVSLILSIISLFLIIKKKARGLGFAISGLVISLILGILFYIIYTKFL